MVCFISESLVGVHHSLVSSNLKNTINGETKSRFACYSSCHMVVRYYEGENIIWIQNSWAQMAWAKCFLRCIRTLGCRIFIKFSSCNVYGSPFLQSLWFWMVQFQHSLISLRTCRERQQPLILFRYSMIVFLQASMGRCSFLLILDSPHPGQVPSSH